MIKTIAAAFACMLVLTVTAGAGAAAARSLDGPLFQAQQSDLLQMLNTAVNAAHKAGAALPSDPDGVWDCDNYAIAKYRTLRDDFHWDPERLALGVARLPDGQKHMVVLVRGEAGWAVLDNLTDAILPLAERTRQSWRVQFAAFEPAALGVAGWKMVPRGAAIARG